MEMIAEGLTNRAIGQRLHLAEKTIRNYVSTVLDKLEVARRAEAAASTGPNSGPVQTSRATENHHRAGPDRIGAAA